MDTPERVWQILSVEDSEDDFELVRNELAEGGLAAACERVDTAEALRAALRRNSWDAVICDHNLPALDSLSALNIVRGMSDRLPFIVVSGSIADDKAIEAMRQGARDFIRKDNLSRLAPALEREIRQAAVQSELDLAQKNLFRVSYFDSLTGLPNCEYLFAYLRAMTCPEEFGHAFAVFLIDLNRFRQITKTLGVQAGDKVLLEVAERLRKEFGSDGFVARLGADRFVAVVPHLDQVAQAGKAVAAIHGSLSGAFRIEGQELYVKASIGASFYPRDGLKWDELFKNAESALYGAKANGGSSYCAYEADMGSLGRERLAMETALYHALEESQFVLHYQPQFDLAGGRLIGAEALIRWRHPELGVVSPCKFVPLLEETGLIVPVGEWVLRTACTQGRRWLDAGLPPVCMAVNLSTIQFRQAGLAQTVRRILDETGLPPEFLELEITENIAMHAEEEVIAILDGLRAIGIRIAIDDFGTGYSSLCYLKRFPIDKLKIDQSFVRDCDGNASDGGIVKAIIGMGRSLNLKVIAEGVETQAQADFLRANGCDEVQGYFYGKPMESGELARLMECGMRSGAGLPVV